MSGEGMCEQTQRPLVDKDLEQRKSQLRGRWDQADGYGEEAAAPGEGHCQTTQRTAQALGQSHGGCESTGAKLEGRECVRGAGGGQCAGGGGGHRAACLTTEAGGDFHGLARSWVLADHLLEANLGDLDQVPCGEAALIPRDLVDGACRETNPVSPLWPACALLPHRLRPTAALHVVPLPGGAFPVCPHPTAPRSVGLWQQEPCLCLF